MSKVLFVSYEFSQSIAGSSLRARGFARYLPKHRWEPIVVTATPPQDHPAVGETQIRYVPSAERRLSGGIRASDEAGLLTPPQGLLARLAGLKHLLPLERQMAWLPAFVRAVKTARFDDVSAILVTIAPYSMLILGRWLARKLDVPLVIDVRDDWIDRFRIERRSRLNQFLLDRFATASLRRADAVVVVSPVTRDRLQNIGIDSHLILNGFDEADFEDLPSPVDSTSQRDALTFLHAGWLGSFRTVEPLLKVLERVASPTSDRVLVGVGDAQSTAPEMPIRFRFRQMGLIDDDAMRSLRRHYHGVSVNVMGQRPHREALTEMMGADVLVAIPGIEIPAAISGKLFEYLRSGRPILMIAGEGAARDLALDAGVRHVVDPNDTASMECAVRELLEEKRAGGLATNFRSTVVASFSRRRSAEQLAEVLDGVMCKSKIKTTG